MAPLSHKPSISAVASALRVTGRFRTVTTVVSPGMAERGSLAEPSLATSATPPQSGLTNTFHSEHRLAWCGSPHATAQSSGVSLAPEQLRDSDPGSRKTETLRTAVPLRSA